MRYKLRSTVICLFSALLLVGLTTAAPAATPTKGVWGWGDNEYGLVGDGTTKQRFSPVRVRGIADASSITHYLEAAYAVKKDGTVWRWGCFVVYEGTGFDTAVIKTPTKVSGLSGVKSVALGQYGGCAVATDGTVWRWKYLDAPTQVAGLSDVSKVCVTTDGEDGYALKRDGTVWEFHGDSYATGASVTRLGHIDGVSSLTAGEYDDHTITPRSWYARKSDGTLWAWGSNSEGQLGDGTQTDRSVPVQVLGLTDVARVTAGSGAAFAVTTTGTVWAWGRNGGQLGDGTTTNRATPVRLPVLSHVAEVTGKGSTWYARTTSGLVYYWGCVWPSHGDAPTKYSRCGKVPMKMPRLSNVRKVVPYPSGGRGGGGLYFGGMDEGGYAIKKDGTLWVWGYVHVEALAHGGGKEDFIGFPVRVSRMSHVTAVFPYDAGAYAIGTRE